MTGEPGLRQMLGDRNLQVTFGITLMAVLAVSSITPAFPLIMRTFDINEGEVGLLITAFTVPGVILAPFLGVLADRRGRRKVLVPCLFLFALAGTLCAFAPTFQILLVLRVIQGVGGASLGSLALTIVGDLYEGKTRATAMGYNESVLNIGTASYPSIGGALATLGWFFPFYLSLLAVPVGLMVIFVLDSPEPSVTESMRRYFARTWRVVKEPRAILLFTAIALSLLVLYGSYLAFFPLLLDSLGANSLEIGLIMSTMSLTTALIASQMGRLSARFSYSTLLKASYPFFALGLVLIPLVNDLILFIVPTVIFGVGLGLNLPSIFTLMADHSPMESRGAFFSLNGLVLRLGQTVGPPLMAAIFALGGFTPVFLSGAGLFALGFLMTLTLRDQPS
ncbi:MAG: MFS transporter [Methanomassiliicoccales archaeon]